MSVGGKLYNAGTPIEDVVSLSVPIPDESDDEQPSVLTEELTAATSVGLIEKGTTYPKGTSLEDILRDLLNKELFPEAATLPSKKVYIGSNMNQSVSSNQFVGNAFSIPKMSLGTVGGNFNPSWANPDNTPPYTKFVYGILRVDYSSGFTGLGDILNDPTDNYKNSVVTTPVGYSGDSIALELTIPGQYPIVRGPNEILVYSRINYEEPYKTSEFEEIAWPLSSVGNVVDNSNSNYSADMTWIGGNQVNTYTMKVNGFLKLYTNGLYQSNNPGVAPETGYPDDEDSFINKYINTNDANEGLVIEHIACLGGKNLWIETPVNMTLLSVKSYDSDKRAYSNDVTFDQRGPEARYINVGEDEIMYEYYNYICNTRENGSNTYQFTFKVEKYTA